MKQINLIDKIGKPGFSAYGGELFIEHHRKDGSKFIEKIETRNDKNLTTIAGGQVAALKLLGLEVNNGVFTSMNSYEPFATYKLDNDSRMTLLPYTKTLANELALCGFAFGKEGSESQARDVVMRYEKGWSSDELLPILYFRTEAEDDVAQNYAAGYFLRSVENGIVKYYGMRTAFKGYGKIVGGGTLDNTYPADTLSGSSMGTEYIIETKFEISAIHFTDYFIYDQLNSWSRRLSSFKVLSGQPVECSDGAGGTVVDFRNIEVTNVVPTTSISLEKDEKVVIVYKQYL